MLFLPSSSKCSLSKGRTKSPLLTHLYGASATAFVNIVAYSPSSSLLSKMLIWTCVLSCRSTRACITIGNNKWHNQSWLHQIPYLSEAEKGYKRPAVGQEPSLSILGTVKTLKYLGAVCLLTVNITSVSSKLPQLLCGSCNEQATTSGLCQWTMKGKRCCD